MSLSFLSGLSSTFTWLWALRAVCVAEHVQRCRGPKGTAGLAEAWSPRMLQHVGISAPEENGQGGRLQQSVTTHVSKGPGGGGLDAPQCAPDQSEQRRSGGRLADNEAPCPNLTR